MLFPGRCIGCRTCVEVCKQGAITINVEGMVVTDRERCIGCGDCAEACHAEAREIAGREMSVKEVMGEIEKELPFYDESGGGVTFSGGEPLSQPDFLLKLLLECKEKEIHTTLDTCGFTKWEVLDKIRANVDLFLYDLKLMDEARHRKFTGTTNEPILKNLRRLSERGHRIIIRVPIIPGINDDFENVRQIGEFAATLHQTKEGGDCPRVDLLPYHPIAMDKYQRLNKIYSLREVQPPTEEKMAEIAHILRDFDLIVRIGD
jgi:pyruvate formate lyase activating enzyme